MKKSVRTLSFQHAGAPRDSSADARGAAPAVRARGRARSAGGRVPRGRLLCGARAPRARARAPTERRLVKSVKRTTRGLRAPRARLVVRRGGNRAHATQGCSLQRPHTLAQLECGFQIYIPSRARSRDQSTRHALKIQRNILQAEAVSARLRTARRRATVVFEKRGDTGSLPKSPSGPRRRVTRVVSLSRTFPV